MITLVLSPSEFDALTDAVDSAITDLDDGYHDRLTIEELEEHRDLLSRWHKLRAKLTAIPVT